MIKRVKRLRIIQISLLIIGSLIIYFTYLDKSNLEDEEIISKEIQDMIKKQISEKPGQTDVFYNIEYSGFDLAGNRYVLKSKEA